MKRVALSLIGSLFAFASLGQPRSYLSVSGGVGVFSIEGKSDRLNYYNPATKKPEFGVYYGREYKSGWGYEAGFTFRYLMLQQTVAFIPSSTSSVADTVRDSRQFRFLLVPVFVTYTHHIEKLQLGIRVGLYLGRRTSSYETFQASNSKPIPISNGNGLNYSLLSTGGVQAGMYARYELSPRFSIGIDGTLSKDLTDLFKGSKEFNRQKLLGFAGYQGSAAHFSIIYRLK